MRWLMNALNLREGEARRVFSLAAYLVVAVSTFITGRIQRDALFLTSFSKQDLAWMYISVAVMVPVPALVFARVADRFRRDRLLVGTLVVTIVCMGLMRLLLLTHQPWVTVLLYNFVEAYGTFLIMLFWTFAGDLFSSREAKRLFPIVSAGSIVAGIGCGLVVSGIVKRIGTENLLLCQMVLLAIGAVIIGDVGRRERSRLRGVVVREQQGAKPAFAMKHQAANVFASKHLKIIAGMTVATFVTVPLIDYQFKVLVKEHFTHAGVVDTDAMSAFMGLFSTMTGVVAAIVQLGITGRLLERFGIVAALLLLPLSLLGGLFAMLTSVASAFACAVFTKGAENSLRYSITDATMQVLYTPVPSATRGRAKTFIDGVVKPLAGGMAGAAMVLLVGPLQLPLTSLAVVAVVLVALWIGLVVLIRREYVRELLATLRKRRLDFSDDTLVIADLATVDVLRQRLAGPDVADVKNALELCRRVQGHDLSASLLAQLDRNDHDVRLDALGLLAQHIRRERLQLDPTRLQHIVNDEAEADDVRAAAMAAWCACVDVKTVLTAAPLMHTASPALRGATVAGIIRHGGLEGLQLATDPLEAMLADDDEAIRFACARVLEEIALPSLHGPTALLLRDDSARVRHAAIAAAGAMRAPELVGPLIDALRFRDSGRAAVVALAGYGDSVIAALSKVLRQPKEDPRRRRAVPRVLERIGSRAAFEALVTALVAAPTTSRLSSSSVVLGGYVDRERDIDADTRRELARCCARLRDRSGFVVDEAAIKALIAAEVAKHYQLLQTISDLGPLADDPRKSLLRDALDVRRERSLETIFRLLGIIQPLKIIETVQGNLRSMSSTARANAIEVLDNLLDADEKRPLLAVVEATGELRDGEGPTAARSAVVFKRVLERGRDITTLEQLSASAWLERFLQGDDEWLVVCALHAVGQQRLVEHRALVQQHEQHTSAVVRETAQRAAAALA
jgi:ATP/ADP translocase/HEAT repeat protein